MGMQRFRYNINRNSLQEQKKHDRVTQAAAPKTTTYIHRIFTVPIEGPRFPIENGI
jgi:hypothetical protein